MGVRKVLLLNASNMETFPVYPYAFIQVPAVARRVGIEVICQDLLGIPQAQWAQTIQSLISQHNPEMILVTLRNTDSLSLQDYEPDGSKDGGQKAYFPIERARILIALLRMITDLKIAIGGFGFSLLPEVILPYLKPDFGVFGSPKAFFDHFDEVLAGDLGGVPNLMYFHDAELMVNPRHFYPPLPDTEYTPQAIQAMLQFYEAFPQPGFLGAPVEIMRGCSHACVFCAEPHVNGHHVQYRQLSAVMGDIQILVDHGITRIYIVSSELNPEGNDFLLQLADRIKSFNAQQAPGQRITWFGANYLLSFGTEVFERLLQSGFTGGWFDITALDDENARLMRTPYRNQSLISDLKAYAHFEKMRQQHKQARTNSQPDAGYPPDEPDSEDVSVYWTLFLGNPATTLETIRTTLQVASEEGLSQIFTGCGITPNIRVFDYENPDRDVLAGTFSITLELERTRYQQHLPSFAYSPALLRHFGSEKAVREMFTHIAETYLSTGYQRSRDWLDFLHQNVDARSIKQWMDILPGINRAPSSSDAGAARGEALASIVDGLFKEQPQVDSDSRNRELALQLVEALLSACLGTVPGLFDVFGIPSSWKNFRQMTPYALARRVFSLCSSEAEFIDAVIRHSGTASDDPLQSFIRFCSRAILYRSNIRLLPSYRQLFMS